MKSSTALRQVKYIGIDWIKKLSLDHVLHIYYCCKLELVSKELNHLAAIFHVYAGGLNFMK